MIDWTAVLFAGTTVAHLLSALLLYLLHRELVDHRHETRVRAEIADNNATASNAEAIARDKALGKLLAPVLRPPARPVRGFTAHLPERAPAHEERREDGGDTSVEEEMGVAVIVWRPGRSDDAERTVREVAG